MALTLTGSCVSQPSDSVHVLSFKSRARVAASQSVTLENLTDKNWFITPVLKGEHWQGAGQLQVGRAGCVWCARYDTLCLWLEPNQKAGSGPIKPQSINRYVSVLVERPSDALDNLDQRVTSLHFLTANRFASRRGRGYVG